MAQTPARSPVPFSNIFFVPTSGRVGYHFEPVLNYPQSDLPYGVPAGGVCVMMPQDATFDGALPPGMSWNAHINASIPFAGTPRQAGSWTVVLHMIGVHCTGGPDQSNYGDRNVRVTFTIEP